MTTRTRLAWTDLPTTVRDAVAGILGGPVVEAVSQSGGFSPGTADRVRTADGTRAFVKAVSDAANEFSADFHRREARVTGALPPGIAAPRLLGHHDDGAWVVLVLSDIDGRPPAAPWRPDELHRVWRMLGDLATALTPSPLADAPTAADTLADDFGGWRRLLDEPPADPDPWVTRHADALCALADRGVAALAGDTLSHLDVRADNILLTADGAAHLVDWPWASVGPAWLDRLALLINVRLHGGDRHVTWSRLVDLARAERADPVDLMAVLAGLGAFFADAARRPEMPGLPGLRAFQRAQAEVVMDWLREPPPAGTGITPLP
jgi:aminoglycoside phosphotransferase